MATKFNDLIFMFQKELGEKIIGKFPSQIMVDYQFYLIID